MIPLELGAQENSILNQVRSSVERSLPLLELASAGSASQRTCFTCHSQAMPVFALAEALQRGIHVDRANLQRQVRHTHKHLERGLKSYQEGKGQGGGVDTAGYALWTLEDGGQPADHVTGAVVEWLLKTQHADGYWKRSSFRPPSEASNFTTTYVALRALSAFGTAEQSDAIARANSSAKAWLSQTTPKDTEDGVFRLLSLNVLGEEGEMLDPGVQTLLTQQREDGGWSQLTESESDAYATGTVLYALHQTGVAGVGDAAWDRAIQFLLKTQQDDGSWFVHSRSKPFQPYYETGFPHREDQFISTTATAWAALALLYTLPEAAPPAIDVLTGTKPLDWPEADLSGRMMQAAHSFVETQIASANRERKPVRGDEGDADRRRQELRQLLGVGEERLPPRMEHFGDDANPAVIFETETYQVLQVRWPVFADVQGEGLLIRQRGDSVGRLVVVPDADQVPEELFGFSTPTADPEASLHSSITKGPAIVRRLAENGFTMIVPSIVSRDKMKTPDPRKKRADYTFREWIYRQAFHMGRHVIGYDIQRVLGAVDWLSSEPQGPSTIGIAGYGEGGLIALHAAAIDTRISSALVSGYFNSSESVWDEPVYRNVWSRLKQFGNAEVAALIAPRSLVLEHSEFPKVTGHKGELKTPEFEDVKSEFDKLPSSDGTSSLLVGLNDAITGPYSDAAVRKFAASMGVESLKPVSETAAVDLRSNANDRIQERQARTTMQLEAHVQSLVQASEAVREDYFLHKVLPESTASEWSTERRHATIETAGFIEATKAYRREFLEQAMGRFDLPLLPPNARTRKVAATDHWTAYDVVLDVHKGLFSWGVLVVPNDIQSGERRPVVVCQHGRNGVPRDTIDAGNSAYNEFAARLADRGYVTFAPHNLYRGEDRYRWLDRKANAIGCTLFSFIIAQHDATLRWLDSLPFVDGDKIAFYGLSYGGETAVRVPAVLEKYCLSICSGDFNQWTRKVASTDQPFSFMNTIEWEMPYWNLGHTFDYAEMSYLMFPRPFMVERGHHDRVGRDQWVAYEFAKVRWLYAQFDMADQVQIEFFQGGHSINGDGTFEFLDQHLRGQPDVTEELAK